MNALEARIRKPMTKRQREALATLEACGKMTRKTIRRHGYAERTFAALATQGLIRREYVTHSNPMASNFAVYRPLDNA